MSDFKDAVVEHIRTTRFSKFVSERYHPIAESVSAALRPVVAACIDEEAPIELGHSKMGGLPHVPADFEWPERRGALAFVCQINLAEVGPHAGGVLPETGMLYLFSIFGSNRAYGHEIDSETTAWIYLRSPGSLVEMPTPLGFDPAGLFEERRLLFGASFICEELNEDDGKPEHKRFDHSIEKAIDAGIEKAGGQSGSTRMLGHAYFFREETRECYAPETETLLLEISGYVVNRDAFGEGDFHVIIANGDLAAGALEKGFVMFEPGT